MSTLSVFRSQAPEVLAAWEAWKQAERDTRPQRRALLDRYPGSKIIHNGNTMQGIWCERNPGEGWRAITSDRWVPRMNTRAGKALAAELEAASFHELRLPGCPWVLCPDLKAYFPQLECIAGWAYAAWSCEYAVAAGPGGMDLSLWEPVKLSDYYAAKEREEERSHAS